MLRLIISALFTTLATLTAGETRSWSNTDGTKSFEAEFISRQDDTVTLGKSDGKELTFDISKLHEDDQRWLNLNYPLGQTGGGEKAPDPHAIFDTLKFGDDRTTVTEKLKASKIVESTVQGTFFGRTGLNGIYHTSHKIGGLYCYLFFDWSEAGELKEITLQTESKSSNQYSTVLEPCWKELIDLIGPIHGKPLQHMAIAAPSKLADGQMLATHLWEIEHGGTAMLGTSRMGDGFQVVVRFTKEKIEVRRIP